MYAVTATGALEPVERWHKYRLTIELGPLFPPVQRVTFAHSADEAVADYERRTSGVVKLVEEV